MGWLKVESPAELDALIGRYITGERPVIHWEDSHAHMRFDTAEEALDALREPYFQQFIPASVRPTTVLQEVQEFATYSSDLTVALKVVEKVANSRQPLRMWRDRDQWCVAFGEFSAVSAASAPMAICLAALRVRGLEVAVDPDPDELGPGSTVV